MNKTENYSQFSIGVVTSFIFQNSVVFDCLICSFSGSFFVFLYVLHVLHVLRKFIMREVEVHVVFYLK